MRRLKKASDGQRQLAVTCHYLGRFYTASKSDRAEKYFKKDVSLCRDMNDTLALMDALNSLGVFYSGSSRYADADVVHKEELGLFERVCDPPRQARALAASGANCLSQGFHTKNDQALMRACRELSSSREIYKCLEHRLFEEEATATENLGRTHFLLGDEIRGKELMLEAAKIHDSRPGGQKSARRIRDELDELNKVD
jgi:hypothetical protein